MQPPGKFRLGPAKLSLHFIYLTDFVAYSVRRKSWVVLFEKGVVLNYIWELAELF